MFINLSNEAVDYDAFESINNSSLVFDSRLVVNSTFCSSDSAVYGAGPLTKFRRSYHSAWSHASFSSKAVGQELAAILLPLFDPTVPSSDEPPPEVVPLYKQATIQGQTLCLRRVERLLLKPTRRLVLGLSSNMDPVLVCRVMSCERVHFTVGASFKSCRKIPSHSSADLSFVCSGSVSRVLRAVCFYLRQFALPVCRSQRLCNISSNLSPTRPLPMALWPTLKASPGATMAHCPAEQPRPLGRLHKHRPLGSVLRTHMKHA